jgi:diacylglycerol kinase family enzyme
VKVDGEKWFKGRASCVLFGNMGRLPGGLHAFPKARCDDGILDVGVVTATGPTQWTRVLASVAAGNASRSKYVQMVQGRGVKVTFDRPVRYELDGGARKKIRHLSVGIEPAAVTVCVPESTVS